MRYVPVEHLQSEMILGQDIHDASGHMLLAKFTVLSQENISYITFLGVPGVYIDDKFSQQLIERETIRPEIRRSAVKLVYDIFSISEDEKLSEEEEEIRAMVASIVEDVMSQEDVMNNLLSIKTYDDYTYFHSVDVAVLAGILAVKCLMPEQAVTDVVTAGFLHDIGKTKVQREVLNAPRRLSEHERMQMMDHPRVGYELLRERFNFNEEVNLAVYQHHEWYNGGGYPNHKAGNQLLVISRILKCADVYDAMTTRRPYHDPYLPSEVIEYIMGRSGMEFDPRVVEIMCTQMSIYPVGCEVELSNGRRGIVVANRKGNVSRPTLRMLDNGEIYDMLGDRSTHSTTITKLMM